MPVLSTHRPLIVPALLAVAGVLPALDLPYLYTPVRIMPETSTVINFETVYSPDWTALGITGYAANNTVLEFDEMRVSRDGWIAATVRDSQLDLPIAVLLRNPTTQTWTKFDLPNDTKWNAAFGGDMGMELAPGGWVSVTAWESPPVGRVHGPTGAWITPPVTGTDTWIESVDLSSTTPKFQVKSATGATSTSLANIVMSSGVYDPVAGTVTMQPVTYNSTTYPRGLGFSFKWDNSLYGEAIKTVDPYAYDYAAGTVGSQTVSLLTSAAFPAAPTVSGFTWPTSGDGSQWEGQAINAAGIIFDRWSDTVVWNQANQSEVDISTAAYLAHGSSTPTRITPPTGFNSVYFQHGIDFSDGSFLAQWSNNSPTTGWGDSARGKWSLSGGFVDLTDNTTTHPVPDYRSEGELVGGDLNGTLVARAWTHWQGHQQQTPFVLVKLPTVSLTAVTTTATEGAGNAKVRFTRTGSATDFPLTIRYGIDDTENLVPVSGTANLWNGSSYYEAIIPAGATTVDVDLVAVNDTAIESNNLVSVSLMDGLYSNQGTYFPYNSSDQSLVYNAGKYTYEYAPGNTRTITVVSDDVGLMPTISRSGSTTTNSPITVTVSFSAATTGVDATDLVASTGSLSGFSGSGSTYTWIWTPPASSQGTASLSLAAGVATAAVGGVANVAATDLSIAYDTAAPTVSTPDLSAYCDLGNSSTDNLTSETALTFTGTAEAGSTVTLYVDGLVKGTSVATGGNWSITSTTLTNGAHNVTASAQDAAGNVSATSSPLSVTIDTVVAVAITTSPAATVATGTPTWSGTCDADATIAVKEGATTLGSAVVSGTAWTFTPASALADGHHTLVFTATDTAGATASATANDVLVDAVGPVVALSGSDLLGKAGETIALTASYSDAGSGVASISLVAGDVTVTPTGTASATVVISGTGTAARTVSLTNLAGNGTLAVSINASTAVDAGSLAASSSNSLTVTVDSTAPTAPTLALSNSSNSGSTADLLTNVLRPVLTGTTENLATVTVTEGVTTIGSTTVATGTTWSVTPSADLTQGDHTLVATATDPAGNVSSTTSLTITIDRQISTPTASPATIVTNSAAPTFSGTADVGTTVTITGSSFTTLTTTAGVGGAWTVTAAGVTPGTYALTVTSTDAAANSATASISLTVDQTAPTVPTTPTTVSTNSTTPTLSGTAESGSTVTITSGGTTIGTATANGSNSWTVTLSSALALGDTVLSITTTDPAGNTSAPATVTVTVDQTAPPAPTVTSGSGVANSATPTFSGTAEGGATITVRDGTTIIGTATASGSGAWTVTVSALAAGAHTLTITAQDSAGNVSSSTSTTVTVVLPAAASSSDGGKGSGGCGLGGGIAVLLAGLGLIRRRRAA